MTTAQTISISVDYELPDFSRTDGATSTQHAWAKVPVEPSQAERAALMDRIAALLEQKNAVLVSHYYVHPDLQDLAERTGAKVLAHPESPAAVLACADAIGSTSGILKAAREMDATVFIVATDNGLMHKLRTLNPGKTFIEAPTAGNSATCKSCAHCPWMAMNSLQGLEAVLLSGANQIQVDPVLGLRARLPIDRMLDFTASRAKQAAGLVPNIGAA